METHNKERHREKKLKYYDVLVQIVSNKYSVHEKENSSKKIHNIEFTIHNTNIKLEIYLYSEK